MDCIFCKIINKEVPADFVYEDRELVVFKDIKPKAPVHFLVVTKKHIPSVNEIGAEDEESIARIFRIVREVAEKKGIKESGYRIIINVGQGGGQEVPHLHVHLLGGWK